jgi:hypothetical protein
MVCILSFQNSLFGYILEGLGMEDVDKYCGHLEYITAVWYILWPLGNFVVSWYSFELFWYTASRKICQPWSKLCTYIHTYIVLLSSNHETVQYRVARFVFVQNTKTGKNILNDHKIYQMAIKYFQ